MAIINDKAALLGAAARNEEMVPVPGGHVRVIELGAVEYIKMLDACEKELAKEPVLAVVGSWACVDENGERLFTVEEFKKLNRKTQFALGGKAMEFNWTTQVDEKNVVAGQGDDSPSGSL